MNIVLYFSPVALFLIMLGVGMTINIKNLINIFKDFKALLTGLLLQMVILPTIGIFFAIFAPVDIAIKLGVILITCVPSAISSNYITKLASGNIALSVSLTAVTSSLSFITIPFILIIVAPIILEEAIIFQEFNFKKISLSLFFMATVPILIGIFINTKFSIFAKKIKKFYSIFSLLLFLIIIFAAWFAEWDFIIGLYKSIGLLVLLLLVSILVITYTLVNLFNLSEVNRKTIIIESLIQNAAAAIIVGSTFLGVEGGYLAIAALYALLQYKILIFLWVINKFFYNLNLKNKKN
jgi:BASS family bile acid:Na+ symporter